MRTHVAALFVLSIFVTGTSMAETHKFIPQAGVATYAVRPPVLRVKPGDIVESATFSRPGDYYETEGGPWPGEVGPFYVEGRRPTTRWSSGS